VLRDTWNKVFEKTFSSGSRLSCFALARGHSLRLFEQV
jgi:hypothetical protein